jgi:acyl dehydratase
MQKVDLTWENVKVGDTIPPTEALITPALIKQYAFAVDDWDPASIPISERSIGQTCLLAQHLLSAYKARYKEDREASGLHARSEMEIFDTPLVGKKIIVTAKHVDKYEKRGHKYRVLESEGTGEDGTLYVRARNTETFGASVGAAKGSPAEAPRADMPTLVSDLQVPCAYEKIPIGAQVTPLRKSVTFEQMVAFTGLGVNLGAGEKTYHTDIEYARSFGLPTVIAQGQMSACYVSELMTRFFGCGWRKGGKMLVKFINAVFAGDVLYVSGTVKEKVRDGDATRIVLDVWCENQAGKKVTVGEVSGIVR